MKRKSISYLFAILSLFATSFLTSCQDDEATPGPTIKLVNPPAEEQTAGATISFSVQADAADKIESITVIEKTGSNSKTVSGFPKTSSFQSSTSDLFIFEYTVPNTTEAIELIFRVTDKNGKESSVSHDVTVKAAAGVINSYNVVLLGSQSSATGSFYNSVDNSVYTLANAKANQAKVDFAYGLGAVNGRTIGAPDDDVIKAIFNNATAGIQTWTTKNQTTFKATTVSTTDFDAASNDALLTANDPGTTFTQGTTSRISTANIAVGKVVAFRTKAGKIGLFKVTEISDDQIKINVKVQK